jgi:hypothetical protein
MADGGGMALPERRIPHGSGVRGAFFIAQAQMPTRPSIANIAGYAGFGAFYFLVSAIWLSVSETRRRKVASVKA